MEQTNRLPVASTRPDIPAAPRNGAAMSWNALDQRARANAAQILWDWRLMWADVLSDRAWIAVAADLVDDSQSTVHPSLVPGWRSHLTADDYAALDLWAEHGGFSSVSIDRCHHYGEAVALYLAAEIGELDRGPEYREVLLEAAGEKLDACYRTAQRHWCVPGIVRAAVPEFQLSGSDRTARVAS